MPVEPSSTHIARFLPGAVRTEDDGRMHFAVYERNIAPILAGLTALLDGRTGNALEIGSGTGQHIKDFAQHFPNLNWTPSDPDADHRRSIDAWTAHAGTGTGKARAIDAAADWAGDVADIAPLNLIFSANVIHIAPWAVAEGILAAAGKVLAPGGLLVFYGPFREGGQHTGEGNAEFDRRLRADNPAWGLRDVDEIAALATRAGLVQRDLMVMPANNRIVVFAKT
ncbi:MAG: DUF938 domain-containing protein [Rhodobacteraceae bacterium]|nr:DUF938 domain-containing protein [Paracoccaceae bacterium]